MKPPCINHCLLFSGERRWRVQPFSFLSGRTHFSGQPWTYRWLPWWWCWWWWSLQAKSDHDDDIQATCPDARLSAEKRIVPISASTQDSDPQMEAATTTRWRICWIGQQYNNIKICRYAVETITRWADHESWQIIPTCKKSRHLCLAPLSHHTILYSVHTVLCGMCGGWWYCSVDGEEGAWLCTL